MKREQMEFDVIIIGAGPAGLSCAVRLAQQQPDTTICVLDKAASIGGHTLSGAVLDPKALTELLPDWQQRSAPIHCQVQEDRFLGLTATRAYTLPTPPPMRNHGHFIISLGQLCQWLGEQAQTLGVNLFPGFAATELLEDDGQIIGIATGDMGVNKAGEHLPHYQPGVEILASQVILAEGCHGSLTQQAIEKFALRGPTKPQTYAIGIKELWEIPEKQHHEGLVVHSIGWPLDARTYGGSFLYHWDQHRISVGFVVGLDYQNPYLDPFQELQRFKTHPSIAPMFEGGKRIGYGARALVEGGVQAVPKLTFPGGMIIGDSAGLINVPKIKGIHTAMKSGMVAADALAKSLTSDNECTAYPKALKHSWAYKELYAVRNIRPGFHYGLMAGMINAALETYVFRGKAPWTLNHHPDHQQLRPASHFQPIDYPKPDGILTFDKLSSVYLANLSHQEDQPCHLQLTDPDVAITTNYAVYASPETRYCPANVYEIVQAPEGPRLQINASNCVHCKTCDIKDPTQNITWIPPEGGSGPNYANL